jgi:hypothetical protein
MKALISAILFLLSASAVACPDLSGAYLDKNKESVILAQKGCEEVSVLSRQISSKMSLDNIFAVVQDDADLLAMGRGIFVNDELVLEVKVQYKKTQTIPAILLPVRGVNKYSQTASGDLLEKSTVYNASNSVLLNTKTVYKRDPSQ